MKRFIIATALLLAVAAYPSLAESGRDIAMKGTKNAPACSACHGARGAGQPAAAIPRLAGLNPFYIEHQLTSFADGSRKNDTMSPFAKALAPAERQAVAEYYAGLPLPETAPGKAADAAMLTAGAVSAERGDWSRGVPACSQCHGANGAGVGATFPRLAGQSANYIEAQLNGWQTGVRRNDPMGLMSGISKKLDKNQIAAVAAYYAALPHAPAATVPSAKPVRHAAAAGKFAPPPDSAIPDDDFGRMVRLGENIFRDTQHYAPHYVGNTLQCSSCHLDGGRLAGSAPLWAAYVAYPAYRSKNKHVNTFEERMQGCFRFSMNSKAPPLGSETLVALESYSYFLAKGAPVGADMPGRGYPNLPTPPLPFSYARGEKVYAQHCALCHGGDGQGQASADGAPDFPPLWGPHSFNWGAGMGSVKNAAAFIKANMPLSRGGSLSVQDSWDVAAYVDGHERPQDPRFAGSVAATRAKYHDSPMSLYGQTVNGVLLGGHAPSPGGH